MANVNQVNLIGRLTRDPQVKSLPNGTNVCSIGLAVSRTYTVDNEQREETTFLDCEAFGRKADVLGKYITKGRELFISGRLRQDTWETDGQKRSKIIVQIEDFQFIGSGNQNNNSSDDDQSSQPAKTEKPATTKKTGNRPPF